MKRTTILSFLITLMVMVLMTPALADPARVDDGGSARSGSGSARERVDPTSNGRFWREGQQEWAILGGLSGGWVLRSQRVPTHAVHLRLRWAVHSAPVGPGILRGNGAIMFELLPFFTMDESPRAFASGFGVFLRHTFGGTSVRPFILGGSGVLGGTEKVPEGEYTFNFETQVGTGVQYRWRPDRAFGIEYRFDHISNAGMTPDNPGINSHLVLVSLSWF